MSLKSCTGFGRISTTSNTCYAKTPLEPQSQVKPKAFSQLVSTFPLARIFTLPDLRKRFGGRPPREGFFYN